MAEPTLIEVFGAAVTQDITALHVAKADLASVGLTASATSKAEGLLVAILLRAVTSLTETNRLGDLVNRNVAVAYTGQDLVDQGGGNVFLRDTYQISLYKATTIAVVSPNNY